MERVGKAFTNAMHIPSGSSSPKKEQEHHSPMWADKIMGKATTREQREILNRSIEGGILCEQDVHYLERRQKFELFMKETIQHYMQNRKMSWAVFDNLSERDIPCLEHAVVRRLIDNEVLEIPEAIKLSDEDLKFFEIENIGWLFRKRAITLAQFKALRNFEVEILRTHDVRPIVEGKKTLDEYLRDHSSSKPESNFTSQDDGSERIIPLSESTQEKVPFIDRQQQEDECCGCTIL